MFKNKLNIFLVVVLVALMSVAVVLGIKVLGKPALTVPDFSTMAEQDISLWIKENELEDKVEIKYEFDDDKLEGEVIYQSIKANEEMGDALIISISKGKEDKLLIDIPISELETKEECEGFFEEYKFENVKYIADSSSDKEEGTILSISPEKAHIEDEVVVKYAGKTTITVPDFSSYSKDKIDSWSKENNITVSYVYESSNKTKDTIITQSVKSGSVVDEKTKITITLSNGDGKKTATIPGTYLGMDEKEFLTKLKDLGFSSFKKDEETYFSATSKKSTIFSYDDGTFAVDRTINYAISEGRYEYKEGTFDDNPLNDIKAYVDELNDRNAHITLKTTKKETRDHKDGDVYDCTSSFSSPNTTISCYLANTEESEEEEKDSTDVVVPETYIGYTEEQFKTAMKQLGFTKFNLEAKIYTKYQSKDQVCGYDSGKINTSKTINYTLSLGKTFTFDASEFNDKSLAKANEVVKVYNNQKVSNAIGANMVLNTTKTETSKHAEGNVYDCSFSGNTVSCKLAVAKQEEEEKQVTYFHINSFEFIQNTESSESYDTTVSNIKSLFSKCENLTIKPVESSQTKGSIVKITVDGNSSYKSGDYPSTTQVVVEIDND